jgi:hypothetical protein
MRTLATTLLLFIVAPLAPLARAQAAKASEKVTYEQHVQPIVTQRCGRCHDEEKMKAGFVATTYAGVLAGSSGSGAVVVAGEPDESVLYLAITHRRDPNMPPGGNKIPQAEIDVIRKWIEGGLLENGGSKAKPKKKKAAAAPALVAIGKPAQPPPLPQDLVLEPVVTSARPGALESLAANPWAPLFAAGGQQQVLLYTMTSGAPELAGILPFPEGLPQCVQFSRDGKTLIASGGRGAALGRVVGWNVASGRRLFEVGNEDDSILAADVSPDQRTVAFGTTDKLVKILTTEGESVHVLKKHTDWVTAVSFSPDGVLLATGDRNGNLSVWESASGREYQTLAGHPAAITGLAWRDDSNLLASSGEDGTIRLWEMQEGKQVKSWPAHGGGALGVAMAHDGRLASCGRDRAVKVWSAEGQLQKQCDGLTEIALRVAFDDEGKRVVAGDWNGLVRVWNAADAKVVGDVALNPPRIADRLVAAEKQLAAAKAAHAATAAASVTNEADAAAAQPVAAAEKEVARWQAQQIDVEWHSALDALAAAEAVRDGKAAVVESATQALAAAKGEVARAEQELAEAPQRATACDAAIEASRAASHDALLALEVARSVALAKSEPRTALASQAEQMHERAAQAPDDAALAAAAKSCDDAVAQVDASIAAALALVAPKRESHGASLAALAVARQSRRDEDARTAALPATIEKLRAQVPPAEASLAAANDELAKATAPADERRTAAAEVERRYRERLAASR